MITTLTGRLYTGGGIDALEENYSHNLAYIAKKLDFYGALDSEFDFFDVVETHYEAGQAQTIRQVLERAGVMNTLYAYRTREVVFDVPASLPQPDISPTEVRNMLTKFAPHPNYIAVTDVSDLEMIDALAGVMADFNIHMFIDVGQMTDWRNVAALVEGLNFNDQRIRVLWNPNKCRPGETSGFCRVKSGDLVWAIILASICCVTPCATSMAFRLCISLWLAMSSRLIFAA